MSKTTLKDISKITGFSIKTVSRALNGHPDINEKTKEKITKIAEEYSYRPNILARSLRQKKAFAIGFIVPDIKNEFFGEVALAIEEKFKEYGYSILLGFSNGEQDLEIKSIELLISRQVDGIVLATIGTTGDYIKKVIFKLKIPLVVIDNKVKGLKTNVVLHDNINGAYLLTKHLIDHDHKKIGCITGPLNETSGKRRLEGCKKALDESKIKIESDFIKISNWKIDGGYNSMLELLNNPKGRPSAIFIANSIMALGSLKAINEQGLKVPKDIAIVSFDDLDFTEATNPPLTTLNKVDKKIGETASIILHENIIKREDTELKEIYIKSRLNIRESCGCIQGG